MRRHSRPTSSRRKNALSRMERQVIMVKFLRDCKAVRVNFSGCTVKLVALGQWAVQAKVDGVTYRRPGFFPTRASASKRALAETRFAREVFLDCQNWEIVVDQEADDVILRRAYKQYRSMGLSPAVSLEYGRNQVKFSKNGW